METQFLSTIQKGQLIHKLLQGDDSATTTIIKEIDRLESVIRDYELGMRLMHDKFENKTFKIPQDYGK